MQLGFGRRDPNIDKGRPHSAKLKVRTQCVGCDKTGLCECSTPKEHFKSCTCGENHTANYRVCNTWKTKAVLPKRISVERSEKSGQDVSKAAVLEIVGNVLSKNVAL